MRRILLTALPAFLAGALATAVVLERGRIPLRGVSARAIGEVPAVSLAEAESQRQSSFSDVRSMEDVLALPGSFARREALYVLAGRSDSAGIQDLIFQASGMADAGDRLDILQVLFSRLAELDPPSALALARTRAFRAEPALEASVWQSWSRLNLEAALRAAAGSDAAHRELAGQALLAANGYRGNERTRRITDVLGVGLSRETQAAWLQRLAADDPAAAFAQLKALERHEQKRAAAALGESLGRNGLDAALRHTDRLPDSALRRMFTNAAAASSARLDPEAALDVLLADATFRYSSESLGVVRQIVEEDPDAAIAYLEKLPDAIWRQQVAGAIVGVLARNNPERGLAWAKANDRGMHGHLHASALAVIALEDPGLAVDEALRIPNHRQKQHALNRLAVSLSREDPHRAVEVLLERVESGGERQQLAQTITNTWLQSDPDEALEWLLGLEETESRQLLVTAGQSLPQLNVDAALRWLPRLDEQTAAAWRLQIASSLAIHRSAAQAQRFIARFEGTADYPQLQMAAIAGIGQTDVDAALRMARQLPPSADKSMALGNLAMQLAMRDPQRAADLLPSIDDETARNNAIVRITGRWARTDSAAAQRWVRNLPHDGARNNAIVQLASTWDRMTPSRRQLLESVDSHVRNNALMNHAFHLARTDREAAEQLIRSMDISDERKQQMLDTLVNNRRRISRWGVWQ